LAGMNHNKILLTGGSGSLGHAILSSGCFPDILAPSHQIFDITKPDNIKKFFTVNNFGAIIHCAALARMAECENNPMKAIDINIIGTCNLVREVMRIKDSEQKDIRFIYISSDGVYPGIRGNYSEMDETIPYNKYGWTKLGAECAVNLLSNFCIIRTSFFDPNNIKFDRSATDMYSSKVTVSYLTKAIAVMLDSNFIGTINIGSERESNYHKYKEIKPSLKPCKGKDILKNLDFRMAYDASLNSARWNEVRRVSKIDD
jgi:dTDP-4-dehydrorhamnose reductase